MSERNLDFDTVIERKGTNCLKYDFAMDRGMPEDILPLWVADMDFRTSSYIQDALIAQIEHGIFGYSEVHEEYNIALKNWLATHHNYRIQSDWIVKTPGVVFALAMAVRAFTKEGEGVLIQPPVYYPFYEVIEANDRKVIENPLVQREDGSYGMDLQDFEAKIVANNIHLFYLCNPHNPVGRAWSREELTALGDICVRHNVVVVSDEIHADFVFQGEHQVLASLKEEYKKHVITCTSPSKTFNLAGLQISNIIIADKELKHKFTHQIGAAGYSQLNIAGLVAAQAAYSNGEEWYQGVKKYIWENILFVKQFLVENLPQIRFRVPEGTYLLWLDCRELGLDEKELEDLVVKKAGLWLDKGAIFGKTGVGFERINPACPRSVLEKALRQLADAVHAVR